MNEFDECGVFGYCVILEFHFNFFVVGVPPPNDGNYVLVGVPPPYDGNYVLVEWGGVGVPPPVFSF
jgi:hypothetical protein